MCKHVPDDTCAHAIFCFCLFLHLLLVRRQWWNPIQSTMHFIYSSSALTPPSFFVLLFVLIHLLHTNIILLHLIFLLLHLLFLGLNLLFLFFHLLLFFSFISFSFSPHSTSCFSVYFFFIVSDRIQSNTASNVNIHIPDTPEPLVRTNHAETSQSTLSAHECYRQTTSGNRHG